VDRNGRETISHTFTGTEQRDGAYPQAGLVSDEDGNLYGTTNLGGAPCGISFGLPEDHSGCGTVFKIDPAGGETILHRFSGLSDSGVPSDTVTRDHLGNLYGSAGGGNLLYGKVFKLSPSGRETDLLNFTYGSGYPGAGLLVDAQGNLYGTTVGGGYPNPGATVFKLDKFGQEIVLHSFTGGADGADPDSTLIMDDAGSLYGATLDGGDRSCTSGCGVIFKITP